jgi:hypothetical protein
VFLPFGLAALRLGSNAYAFVERMRSYRPDKPFSDSTQQDGCYRKMARLARFERTTCRLGGGCSIQLSYRREAGNVSVWPLALRGGQTTLRIIFGMSSKRKPESVVDLGQTTAPLHFLALELAASGPYIVCKPMHVA